MSCKGLHASDETAFVIEEGGRIHPDRGGFPAPVRDGAVDPHLGMLTVAGRFQRAVGLAEPSPEHIAAIAPHGLFLGIPRELLPPPVEAGHLQFRIHRHCVHRQAVDDETVKGDILGALFASIAFQEAFIRSVHATVPMTGQAPP